MSLLVKLELQKLIRRKYLFVGAILLVIYTLFWFFVCAVNHAATFPTHTETGRLLEGRQAALYNKVLYEQYAGELTDEKVAEILDDFQTLRNRYETTHSDLFNAPLIYEDFSMFKATDENAFEKHYPNMGISALTQQIFQTLKLLFISHFQVHGKPLPTFFIMAVLGLASCF